MRTRRSCPAAVPRLAFAGFRFPPDVIVLAVRWYLRFGLSYRDVEELLTERGVEVDHVTVYRWVLRFTPLLAEAARPCRHLVGDRWQVDETYVRVAGRWRYVYRAVDQFGQVIDVFVSARRDAMAARRFFERAIDATKVAPTEVVTDQAPVSWPCWKGCCQRHGTAPIAMATTELKRITAGSRRGSGRCAGSNRTAAPGWSSPSMPSSRTSGEGTMSWQLAIQPTDGWLSRSTIWS
jgi:transposase-like protein